MRLRWIPKTLLWRSLCFDVVKYPRRETINTQINTQHSGCYSTMATSTPSAQRAWIWGLTRPGLPLNFFADSWKRAYLNYAVAGRKQTLGFSTFQFAFQCHDIVKVIQYFQIWGNVSFLFIWTLQRWILCCQYLLIFGNRFVHTSSALIILIEASLKTLSQHRWWQLDVLADDHYSNWMKWWDL